MRFVASAREKIGYLAYSIPATWPMAKAPYVAYTVGCMNSLWASERSECVGARFIAPAGWGATRSGMTDCPTPTPHPFTFAHLCARLIAYQQFVHLILYLWLPIP
jgi:hypothetical protein